MKNDLRNNKQQRSKIESERLGHRSTDTNKSSLQKRASYNTDSTNPHGGHADGELQLWHLDTIKRTRKNDTTNSTQNASLHRPGEGFFFLKKKKTQPSRNDEDEGDEKANHRSSDEETAEGGSSNTDHDQNSDISFTKDTYEEIDTGEIEEDD